MDKLTSVCEALFMVNSQSGERAPLHATRYKYPSTLLPDAVAKAVADEHERLPWTPGTAAHRVLKNRNLRLEDLSELALLFYLRHQTYTNVHFAGDCGDELQALARLYKARARKLKIAREQVQAIYNQLAETPAA